MAHANSTALIDIGSLTAALPAVPGVVSEESVRLNALRMNRKRVDVLREGRVIEVKCCAKVSSRVADQLVLAGRQVLMMLNLGSHTLVARRFPVRG